MPRKPSMSDEQMSYLDAHLDTFPAEVKKLSLFRYNTAVTRSVIGNYQRRKRQEVQPTDSEELAEEIQTYIIRHGLPVKFQGKNNVTGFVDWLHKV